MEKLKMHSPNFTQDNIARVRDLFPDCVTEAKGEDGTVKLAVDFDQLRQELAESIVEGPQERYHLNWPGKREALLAANAPIAKTLRPCREESVDFDTTKNLFIEGDNLDALKLLQETYLGKVKMIYIDPPYNTGNDFIYEDDFAESTGEYLRRSNQVDEKGNRLVANTAANGRFHSNWLSMMYSRLRLARSLLREDVLGPVENPLLCSNPAMERRVLSDKQWALMAPHCLGKPDDAGPRGTDNRLFVEAVLWIVRTGSPWRDLPEEFGKCNTVFKRFRDWVKAGIWQKLFDAVSGQPDMQYAMVDATIVKVHRHGQGAGLKARP